MTLVASSRPPRPTSTMQASAGVAREGEEGGRGGRLEEADLHALGQIERLLEHGGKHVVVDQRPARRMRSLKRTRWGLV
jgi:hypothetical protein